MTVIDKFTAFYTDLETMQVRHLKKIYSDDVVFIDPIAEHKGLKSVENYFERLLKNAKYCQFEIKRVSEHSQHIFVQWQMKYTTKHTSKERPIIVDGITQLELDNEKIVFHKDYYDLGQMVYENIPFLGRLIKRIKQRLR